MKLVKNGRLEAHSWSVQTAGEPVAVAGDVIIGLYDLIKQGETAFERTGRTGLALQNNADLGLVSARLSRLDLVTIDFPAFADGRGFSLAHELRNAHRYGGELWAQGYLIPDQYSFALQCGFDAVLINEDIFARQGERGWAEAAKSMNLRYQTAHGGYDGAPQSILALRRQARQLEAAE